MKLKIHAKRKDPEKPVTRTDIIRRLKKGYAARQKMKEKDGVQKIYLPEGVILPTAFGYPVYQKEGKKEEADATQEVIEGIDIPTGSEVLGAPLKLDEERETLRYLDIKYPLTPLYPQEGDIVFAYAHIHWDTKRNNLVYSIIEPEITQEDKLLIADIKKDLEERLDIDFAQLGEIQAKNVLLEEIRKSLALKGVDMNKTTILSYYIERDIIGLGKIDPIMKDPNIEDVSCDGVMTPIYIYHRDSRIASIRSNVYFEGTDELNDFVSRLAQKSNKTISVAEPLLDATLPEGSRVQATLGTDIARKGSNFTIRKFTEKPLTPTNMLKFGTVNSLQLAYLWLAIDNGQSILISGGSATGKTSLLNALSLFIRPTLKIITIEDSVTGDSNILVWNKGNILKTTIGELVDNQITCHGTHNLLGKEISDNPEGIMIFSLNKEGKISLQPVSNFIRHKTDKKIYEVTTRTGRRIKVTGDHSLFGLSADNEITPISVNELEPGSFIATPRTLPQVSGLYSINLLEYPDKLNGLFVKWSGIKRMKAILYKKYDPKKASWWINNKTMPVKEFADLNIANDVQVSIRPKNGGKEIQSTISLDTEFMEFLGLWFAEGCYDKNSIIISNGDEECNLLVKRVAEKFHLKTKKHSDNFSQMINSSVLKKIMQNVLEIKGDAYTKSIPSWIFGLDNNQIASLLRGYFSGDGHVSKFEVQLRSSSIQMLKDIQTLLLRFGIISRIGKFYHKDHTYGIRISSSEMARKFREINFLQERKREKLSLICSRSPTHATTDIIPVHANVLRIVKNEIGSLRTNSYFYGSNIGRNALQNLTMGVNTSLTKKLSMLANSDVFWDEVKWIKPVDDFKGYVYDLSVPRTENFVCENIIAHNTAELRLPHPHWVPQVARTPLSIEGKTGEVSLFDLLKASLRQRPDYIIVGEVRGKEAFVLFQQMATGHSALATIHAASLPQLVDRLITPPISLPPSLLENINIVVFLALSRLKGNYVRRSDSILEIIGVKNDRPQTNRVFKWTPITDVFEISGKSVVLRMLAKKLGITEESIKEELIRRKKVLEWMLEQEISDYRAVSEVIELYYADPEKVMDMIVES